MTSGHVGGRRVFLDANVIIEAFRISVWAELSGGCHLETVQECEKEALTGRTDLYGHVAVDAAALRAGLKACHLVGRPERNKLVKTYRACLFMDPGEKDLFAYLFANHHPLPPLIVVSSADKGVAVRAKDLGWLDQLISLEELLHGCGVARAKLAQLDTPHRASFLGEVRTKVMLGVIP
jgi:hypothetical protein